ncbi:hypothetical protein LPJ75_002342 [Coemansia sp. RSA 2598]|nr:hypothetical protein LPJ75_002342 [Coemansia sp. RSA 2598]
MFSQILFYIVFVFFCQLEGLAKYDFQRALDLGLGFSFGTCKSAAAFAAPLFALFGLIALSGNILGYLWLFKGVLGFYCAGAALLRPIKRPYLNVAAISHAPILTTDSALPAMASTLATQTALVIPATSTMMATVTVSHYVHYKRIKAPLVLGKANADVLVSSLRLALSVGSARSLMTDKVALCLAASSARCCYLALAIRPVYSSTSSICEITSDLDNDDEPETAVKRQPLPPVAWMVALTVGRQCFTAIDNKTLPEPKAQDRETDAIADHATLFICFGDLSFPLELAPISVPMLIPEPVSELGPFPELELKLEPEPEPEPVLVSEPTGSVVGVEKANGSSTRRRKRTRSKRCVKYRAAMKQLALLAESAEA